MKTLISMICLTVICLYNMYLGNNGTALVLFGGLIGGLGGYEIQTHKETIKKLLKT